ncbi:MAG: ComEC/Rec2 family competence protein [Clostridia bacterium]|nr:ComEC/Rec2 family competence protein [Clostridia bacterium]
MQILRCRPLALFCAVLSLCSVLALRVDATVKLYLALVGVGSFLIIFLVHICKKRALGWMQYLLAPLLGIAVAFSSSYLYFDCYLPDLQKDTSRMAEIEGTVLSRGSSNPFASVFFVSLEKINGEPCGERVVLECEYPSGMQSGDRFEATVLQRDFEKTDSYNEESYYLADGYTRIFTCADFADCEIGQKNDTDARVWFSRLNTELSVRLADYVGEREGGFIAAILLGNRSMLSDMTETDFRRVGVSHLLALSGLHVSVLIGFLELLMRRLHIGRLIRAAIIPPVLIGYLALTGFSVSAIRAVLMVCIMYLGYALRADYDSFTSLCAVLALLLTFTPYAVLDLSLWLSFLAAASIIVFSPWIFKIASWIKGVGKRFFLRRWLAATVSAILVGAVANAAILMFSAFVFGEISVLSVPATLLLSPLMSLLMILSVPLLLFPKLPILLYPCRFLSALILDLTEWMSDLEGILLTVGSKTETAVLVALSSVLILLAVLRIRHATAILVIPLLTVILFVLSHLLTVNTPRAYLESSEECPYEILCEGGNLIAVDRGAVFASDTKALIDLAREYRCTEIGDLCIAEFDNRTPYTVAALASRIRVHRIRLPIPTNEGERAIAIRIGEEAAVQGIEIFYDVYTLAIEDCGDPYLWESHPPVTE